MDYSILLRAPRAHELPSRTRIEYKESEEARGIRGKRTIDHVATGGVHDALGGACAAAGVEHKQGVLGIHPLHLALVAGVAHELRVCVGACVRDGILA